MKKDASTGQQAKNQDAKQDSQEQVLELSLLFDLYGNLLTEKKRYVMELYHENDLSLSEIAEEQGISRAAVHDALKSAERSLREYERKLGFLGAYKRRIEIVKELRDQLDFYFAKSANGNSNEANKVQATNTKAVNESIDKLLSELED